MVIKLQALVLRHPPFFGGKCQKAMLGVWVATVSTCTHFRTGSDIQIQHSGRHYITNKGGSALIVLMRAADVLEPVLMHRVHM